jgi:hypothetical protein
LLPTPPVAYLCLVRCMLAHYTVVVIVGALLGLGSADAATLAGQVVRPGGTLDIRFPVDKSFQDVAAEGGNPRPTQGRALVSFPKGFDPVRTWSILVVLATTDAGRTNIMDAPFYLAPATSERWIVLASDATISTRLDSTSWRLAHLAAALQALRKEWPQSVHWPVAFAGLSGGAKLSGVIGAMLASTKAVKPCGFFLAGINDDRLSVAYKMYHPAGDFLNTPIWLSSGMSDQRASYGAHERVRASLLNTGFKRVRLETFPGGHEVDAGQVQLALRWFREVGNF